jgi:hypothetical protein
MQRFASGGHHSGTVRVRHHYFFLQWVETQDRRGLSIFLFGNLGFVYGCWNSVGGGVQGETHLKRANAEQVGQARGVDAAHLMLDW